MTAQSKKWSRLARDISESYTMWDETLAVTLGGSVAREIADDSSDVDIFCILHIPPIRTTENGCSQCGQRQGMETA